ncbi:TetR/AcrR family transcriptional regulator [Stenotrophomonas mori]|uniref:TetR/AcrR family transcriptional regulator n=1 Tax=Stenotrophomonas mori TaxID=2871096 RepID=A0ABT0SK68_9GAMM|nr:TetR/AcrR family transcriptional regulator [Stenotrophomonas mori]MCL7715657.1 TetR/AcrR family transcriptional regulator [Stenotrophomonas mori]
MSSHPRPRTPGKATARGAGPGRPKDLGKRAAILETAKEMFIELGFNGVSMDGIATGAGVSKLTVYSHFGDKETLFTEAIQAKCVEMMPDELFVTDSEGPLREQLRGIGHAFFTLVSSDAAIATQRMMLTPETDDRIRQMFWQAGPQRTETALAEFLGARVARGELAIDDLPLAARQFFCLIKGELHAHMMCGLCPAPAPGDAAAHIDTTVDFFIRAYAPRA